MTATDHDNGLWSAFLQTATSTPKVQDAVLLILGEYWISPFLERSSSVLCVVTNSIGPNEACQQSLLRHLQILTPPDLKEKLANRFGLGYTFVDFKDDHDFCLSRLDVYTLDMTSDGSTEAYSRLVRRILKKAAEEGKKLLVDIALDGSEDIKSHWISQIIGWLSVIHEATKSLDLSENIAELRKQVQSYSVANIKSSDSKNTSIHDESEVMLKGLEIPLGEYEFRLPLGVKILISVVGYEKLLQKYANVLDDSLDTAQQVLRFIALLHGGSVIYLSESPQAETPLLLSLISETIGVSIIPGHLQTSIPSAFGEDSIYIPVGWDSKGKIAAIRGDLPFEQLANGFEAESLHMVEQLILSLFKESSTETEIIQRTRLPKEERRDYQVFLAEQFALLEKQGAFEKDSPATDISIEKVNVAGIKVEGVDEVLRRLKARDQLVASAPPPATPSKTPLENASSTPNNPSTPSQNEVLASFFQSLLDRKKPDSSSST